MVVFKAIKNLQTCCRVVFFFVVVLSAGYSEAQASQVKEVNGDQLKIQLDKESLAVGQKFFLIDTASKKLGIIKILHLNGNLADAQLLKGKAEVGYRLMAPAAASKAGSETPPAKNTVSAHTSEGEKKAEPKNESSALPSRWSVLLGMSSNSSAVKVTDGTIIQTVQMTGNSYAVSGVYEKFWSYLAFRGLIGYEEFDAIGAATVSGCSQQTSKDCKTNIKYLTAGGFARYSFDLTDLKIWLGAGAHVKAPVSKSSTAILESSLGTTMSYAAALGLDYQLKDSAAFVPISLEQQFYYKSDTADSRSLTLRVGFGKEF